MKIAQVSPLYESVPPKLYGGTERIVSFLTEELVGQGHDVTLFASGDSKTTANLFSVVPESLRLGKSVDQNAPHVLQLQEVIDRRTEFDIIHFHTDYFHYPVSKLLGYKHITTLHGRLDIPELLPLYKKFSHEPLISISNNQRIPLSFANWKRTVYHGLPIDLLQEGRGNGEYLVFLGRVSPEKGLDKAIEIAKKAGIKIKIAAKIDTADKEFYEQHIARLFDDPLVEYVGEVNEEQKQDFLGDALALLFPINWPEPFGLVMIESFAVGTPVIAFRSGSVPEIIDEGVNGFVVSSVEEAVLAIMKINKFSRKTIREVFEKRFTSKTMAENYIKVYEELTQ
jgi:glycosyltransferase involved in cell wall biosynthesis